jgi:4-aminobutyrate aminotransferase-like enzyme
MLARLYTGSEQIYTFKKAYHGMVGNACSLTSVGSWASPMPKLSPVHHLAFPCLYRNPHFTVDTLIKDAE